MELKIRKCTMEDLSSLRVFLCRTFRDTFESMNTPANMKAYLNKELSPAKISHELSSSGSSFYFLYADGVLSGCIKLNEYGSQTDIRDPRSLEIERIYVAKELKGKGLGGVLMETAVSEAQKRGKSYMWLGVWEKNESALGFYKKYGFYVTGRHPFMLGKDEQIDLILRKDLV